MITCLSKNDRAYRLFDELHALNAEFVNVGQVKFSRNSHYRSALASLRFNYRQFQADTYFSPILAREMEKRGSELLSRTPQATRILSWGAVNFPTVRSRSSLPYSLITDGPYDPDDPGYPVQWRPARWSKEYLQRQRGIYRAADRVFTLSDWARDKIIRIHNLSPEKVVRVGWGPMHRGGPPKFDVSGSGYFVSVGTEWKLKGMDIAAQATAILRRKFPEAYIVLIGEPRGLKIPKTEGVVQLPYSVPGRVTQTLIANARAVVAASRFDSALHVTYEALQVGTPVIGTRVGGVPEGIQAPRGGRVVPKEDPEALAAAMEDIWTENIAKQRENAYQVYLESGGWKRSAQIIAKELGLAGDEDGAGRQLLAAS
jgi:glycosyltransferase involved in cell wall biosynthesis